MFGGYCRTVTSDWPWWVRNGESRVGRSLTSSKTDYYTTKIGMILEIIIKNFRESSYKCSGLGIAVARGSPRICAPFPQHVS